MASILDYLNKPEYLLRPSQLVRRFIGAIRHQTGAQQIRLPWGADIWVDPSESIGRAIAQSGVFELAVTEALWRLIDPGDLVVDIGANVGYMTSVMARRCGPQGKVWSFEPHPEIFGALEKNVETWRSVPAFTSVAATRVAMGDASGSGDLIEPPGFEANRGRAMVKDANYDQYGAQAKTHPIEIVRMDGVFPEDSISLAKIDVEGGELRVLHGAQRMLEAGRIRDIVFEDFGLAPTPAMIYLEEFGYTIFALGRSFLGPRLASCAAPGRARPWETPNYLATIQPDRAILRMKKLGWSCLRGRNH